MNGNRLGNRYLSQILIAKPSIHTAEKDRIICWGLHCSIQKPAEPASLKPVAMGKSDEDLLPADIKKEVKQKVNFVRRQPKKGDEALVRKSSGYGCGFSRLYPLDIVVYLVVVDWFVTFKLQPLCCLLRLHSCFGKDSHHQCHGLALVWIQN